MSSDVEVIKHVQVMKHVSIVSVKIHVVSSVSVDEMLSVYQKIIQHTVPVQLISVVIRIQFVLKHHQNVQKIQNVYLDTFVKILNVLLDVVMITIVPKIMHVSMVYALIHVH